jgi:cell fate regulator YaaT (PSP1 superfamily)
MKQFNNHLIIIFALIFVSCGKNKVEENTLNEQINEERTGIVTQDTLNLQKQDSANATAKMDQNQTRGTILGERKFIKKRNPSSISENADIKTSIEEADKETKITTNVSPSTSPSITTTKKVVTPSNFTIQKILNGCEVGKTLTQEELSKNLAIPKDAIKLVKSITKISEDEIEIKWNSTWLVEKISDAKFNDGRLKVRFADNKMYTSGNAIGIKYDKKLYTDLVVYGRAAHIPSVKGFYWQIGKGK